MNTERSNKLALILSSAFVFAACGAKTPSAESPSAETAPASSAATGAASASAPAAGAPAEPGKAGKAEPAAPGASSSKRVARDILELKDTVFFLAFDESDPKKGAEASCEKSTGKNAKKMAACMSKARDQADEGYRFEQDKDGTLWWLVVHRKGNALVTVHRVRYTYGTETDSSVVIKPEGKDMGSKAWKKPPAELKFDVPTEYRLIVQDPSQGKLVYEAKSGIATGK